MNWRNAVKKILGKILEKCSSGHFFLLGLEIYKDWHYVEKSSDSVHFWVHLRTNHQSVIRLTQTDNHTYPDIYRQFGVADLYAVVPLRKETQTCSTKGEHVNAAQTASFKFRPSCWELTWQILSLLKHFWNIFVQCPKTPCHSQAQLVRQEGHCTITCHGWKNIQRQHSASCRVFRTICPCGISLFRVLKENYKILC